MKMLWFLLFLTFSPVFASDYSLSICSIFKDEAPYLNEWIRYHKLVGVEHFWLYNNGSCDDYLTVLDPWIKKGIVELIDWPNSQEEGFWGYTTQPAAYRDALKRARGKTKWLAIIDLDEFIVPMKKNSVPKILKKYYKDATAVYVNWLQFGTSNVSLGPGGSMLFGLTQCAQRDNMWNTIGKSIVRPEAVTDCRDPHFCVLRPPLEYFNGDGKMTLDWKHHDGLLRINHYTFRDEWYFINVKIPRCLQWNMSLEDLLKRNDEFNKEENIDVFRVLLFSRRAH